TPVRSTVSTAASTSIHVSSMRKFTSTEPTSSGWHSGMRSAARLAAWMPATRATLRTSPFDTAPRATSEVVSGCMCTRARATARRWLGSFGVTSTMRARPSGSRWVRPRSDMPGSLLPRPRGGSGSDDALLLHVDAQPLPELGAEVVALQRQLHGGLQVVELVAGVVATVLEGVAVHVLAAEQQLDGVGELDLAAPA